MRRSFAILCLLLVSGCFHNADRREHQTRYICETDGTNRLDNLDYGVAHWPDVIIDRPGYACGYSEEKNQPLWVSYRLTREEATQRVVKREGKFYKDLTVVLTTPEPEDYKASGYDRGHIAPAGDMAWSKRAMKDSFYMTNMSPQVPMFNRGIWRLLETWVREEAARQGSLFVYSGPIFATNSCPKRIGFRRKIEVPVAYYKVLLAETEPPKMIGFILENKPSTNSLYTFSCTVDDVESITGFDFFSALDYVVQTNLESKVDIDLWHLK